MVRKTGAIASLLALMVACPTAADAVEVLSRFGGWTVVRGDDVCFASATFEGPGSTRFLYVENTAGDVFGLVENDNWSVEEGRQYTLYYEIDGETYRGGSHRGTEQGIFSNFDDQFAADFAFGTAMRIYYEGQVIADLSLKGTHAAVKAVRACRERLFAALPREQRDAIRFRDIAVDPFAPRPSTVKGAVQEAVPHGPIIANQEALATTDEYPSKALREGWEGNTVILLSVDPEGQVIKCEIASSSGHQALDDAACQSAERKAKIAPARDATGVPVAGTVRTSVEWRIPF